MLENENSKTENEIVLIKDSYANCFAPFLTVDYRRVHIIDPRYFKGMKISNYIKKNPNISDVLILYGIITILRQFIEPKIIGKSLGLHPLISLISMYMGFRLFGVFGMITGPLTAMVISSIIRMKNGKNEADTETT